MSQQNTSWAEYKAKLLADVDPRKQKYMNTVLENQRTYLKDVVLKENASALPGNPSVGTANISVIPKMTIPMIRRILPATIASDLVGIQPLSAPVGLISSLRYTYAGKAGVAHSDTEDLFPADANLNKYYGNTPAGWGNATTGMEDAFNASWSNETPIYGDEMFGSGYKKANGAKTYGYNRLMRRFYSGGLVTDGTNSTLSGYGAPTDSDAINAGNSWYGQDMLFPGLDLTTNTLTSLEGQLGNQVGIEILRDTVSAISRKLSAKWTPEAQQDLKAMNGLDMEDELTTAISSEIMQEIDNEIISDLLSLPDASNVQVFDLSKPIDGFTPTFLGDSYANLGPQILKVANNIAKRTRRGPANWVVAAPQLVTVLQTAAKSIFAPAITGNFEAPENNRLVGTLNNQMKVYTYLWFDNDTMTSDSPAGAPGVDPMLMGYKGAKEMDAGYFYCPYVPLMAMPTVIDPYTGEMVISFMTRYGKLALTNPKRSLANSADYYGKVVIKSTIQYN